MQIYERSDGAPAGANRISARKQAYILLNILVTHIKIQKNDL